MELPLDIEKQILEYLHLEYGEDPGASDSLNIEDISYEGEFEINGISTHYFKYASSTGRTWATVEPFGDSYCLGMTSSTPKPITKSEIYKEIHVKSLETNDKLKLELESWGEGCFGFSDYKKIELSGKIQFELLAEVSSHSSPPAVTVSIIDGDSEVYVCGSVGISMRYTSVSLGEIFILVGALD